MKSPISWLSRWLGTAPEQRHARSLYESAVTQARQPVFYRDHEVPDTLDAQMLEDAKAVFSKGEKMQLTYSVQNTLRGIGTRFSSPLSIVLTIATPSASSSGPRITTLRAPTAVAALNCLPRFW